jgi:hypothetical protein
MVPLLYRDGQSGNEVLINIAETRNVSAFDGYHSPRGRFWRSGPSRGVFKTHRRREYVNASCQDFIPFLELEMNEHGEPIWSRYMKVSI